MLTEDDRPAENSIPPKLRLWAVKYVCRVVIEKEPAHFAA